MDVYRTEGGTTGSLRGTQSLESVSELGKDGHRVVGDLLHWPLVCFAPLLILVFIP